MSKERKGKYAEHYQLLISEMLGESPLKAKEIFAEWERAKRASRGRWLTAANSAAGEVAKRTQKFEIDGLGQLTEFLDRKRSSGVVLCTIHMGDYLHGLAAILGSLSKRKVFIVRQKEASEVEAKAFGNFSKAMGFNFEVIRTTERTAGLRVLRNLRRGAVVVMLYDLPFSYGETIEVEVLGRSMHWVGGPSTYAARADAFVVPFFCFQSGGVSQCELSRVLQVKNGRNEVSSATQTLASLAEQYIRRFPGQWLHWYWVADLLAGGSTISARSEALGATVESVV